MLVQERLGLTLERLAARGASDLYAGETARSLVAGLQALGAPMALADLAVASHRRRARAAPVGVLARSS